ncbi:MAG: hypothetical protein PHD95_02600 [Candidatus ainarchaeum sp.]|nr:hypothetical protein [Candidatus ainarchaeum sp.]
MRPKIRPLVQARESAVALYRMEKVMQKTGLQQRDFDFLLQALRPENPGQTRALNGILASLPAEQLRGLAAKLRAGQTTRNQILPRKSSEHALGKIRSLAPGTFGKELLTLKTRYKMGYRDIIPEAVRRASHVYLSRGERADFDRASRVLIEMERQGKKGTPEFRETEKIFRRIVKHL